MNKRKIIGVFATEISSRVQSNFYEALHEKAGDLGYNLVFFSASYERNNMDDTDKANLRLFELAEKMELAAIIIHGQSIGDVNIIKYVIELGIKRNIPVFLVDSDSLELKKYKGVICVDFDYEMGFSACVRHLIEVHKCKNIFMLAGMKNNKYSDERVEAYKKEMTAHGLSYCEEMIGYGNFWEVPAKEAVNKFMDSDLPIPEAICCANDSMAIAAVKVLEQRGYRVPEDILVTGFDGIEDGKYAIPPIATCEPIYEDGADFILKVLMGESNSNKFLIPLKFLPKVSCGCSLIDRIEDRKEIARLVEYNRQSSWQQHMLGIMQFELIDSSDLSQSAGYMQGALNLLSSYSHLFCIREDLGYLSDYSIPFDKMYIHLNHNFLPESDYGIYDISDKLFPDFDSVIYNAEKDDLFVFELIHCAKNTYGFHVFKTNKYTSGEVKLLSQFVENFTNLVEGVLRNKRLSIANQKLSEMYEHMSEIYVRDTMTGLYNRHGYYQELDEYITRDIIKDGYLHVLSIDMDKMKNINDNYGHIEGDHAIKCVAKAIGECFAHPCVTARFGGDEFMVSLFTTRKDEISEDKISLKLNDYLECTPLLSDKEYKVKVSVGMSTVKVSDIKDYNIIEKLADECMYKNKKKHHEELLG